jgi:NDP-sugar pyrophosphorylase family protein
MKAMIFSAGLGTRLSPVTRSTPKALAKINGIHLLEIVIKKLVRFGYDDLIINVHHFADEIEAFITSKRKFGVNISFSDERAQLLDTGGGLKHASWFFNDSKPFIVHNVDILSNIDLKSLMDHHLRSKALATLAVRTRNTSRLLFFNKDNLLCGWENIKTGERKNVYENSTGMPYAFSGIQVIDPSVFQLIDDVGMFGIIDVYLRLAKNHRIGAYVHDKDIWLDVGNPENLKDAEKLLGKIL